LIVPLGCTLDLNGFDVYARQAQIDGTILNGRINKPTPTITWNKPASITYGTPLSATQLDASASVPGVFVYYSPVLGTILKAGDNQTLRVAFTPVDTTDYSRAAATVTIDVAKATPIVSVSAGGGIANGSTFPATATIMGVVPGVDNTPSSSLEEVPVTLTYYAGPTASGPTLSGAPAGAGMYTVVASFAGSADYVSASASTTFTITPAAAASFVLTGFPSTTTAGVAGNFTVNAYDPYGNVVTGYRGTVTFSSSAAKAALPANYTFTSADAGVHTFSAILRSAGSQSITAKDTVTSSISGSETGITVHPGAIHHLVLSRFPSQTTAGVSQTFRITAQDLYGNTVTGFTDVVALSSSDGQAVLPANYTFTSADAGVHTFSATLETAGIQSLTAKDSTTTGVTSGTRSGITVTPAATSQLLVAGFPVSVTAGTAYNFTVTAKDPYGNRTPAYTGTVMFSSTDNQAVLPANYPFTGVDAGTHTFSATLNNAGSQSLTATDTAHAGITGTESGISVVMVQPTASISGPSVGVPGQPLTIDLGAGELGLPGGTMFTYSVQWGDGSPVQTLSGPSGMQAIHTFVNTGGYSVSATATDPNGNASVPASTGVSISTVAMETDAYNSSLTALFVGGTTGNDTIAITPVAGGGVKVGMNFVNYGSFFPTGHVLVFGQSGNDIIKTAAQIINGQLTFVTVPLLIFAGDGNDILNASGSIAGNVLVGGAGADRLIGGRGRDILIGGPGPSTLQAGSGGDILIGGTTSYDDNAAALAAILAEWSRTDIDYATRIAHLTGTSRGGLNGADFLNTSTVQDDGQVNKLYGGAGLDWYFEGMADVIFNQTSGEVVTHV
jgi:Ca2+-binding RTX toxin-like protein